ncbi:hypothetical protein RJ639_043083 [Escallonia herrerae]|uniref:Ras-related protein RABC2a-like n=1 Tax=Escallonia herrerae TaxID=1293975 RepID=A0AA89B230_9ASTE|nr:hypothetical protein RJ639_043083 [Escallonia herrerae]
MVDSLSSSSCSSSSTCSSCDSHAGRGGKVILSPNSSSSNYDYSFKILLVGDSGVGKSSLLLSFLNSKPAQYSLQDLSPTIGVDFKIKLLTISGKRMKLTIWDTAGQERFGTLISSYYRGAHGIILVYDVTRRETFTNLSEIWAKEIELYSTNRECIKILVGNKVDRDSERAVTKEEGMALAEHHQCLFYECSAKTRENVQQCFKELALKVNSRGKVLFSFRLDGSANILVIFLIW